MLETANFMKERQLLLLKSAVSYFLKNFKPIASDEMKQLYGFKESSATLRQDLAILTDLGYFTKAFSSAGRLPTSRAFRFSFDFFLHARKHDGLCLPLWQADALLSEWSLFNLPKSVVLDRILTALFYQSKQCVFVFNGLHENALLKLDLDLCSKDVVAIRLSNQYAVQLFQGVHSDAGIVNGDHLRAYVEIWQQALSTGQCNLTFLQGLNERYPSCSVLSGRIYQAVEDLNQQSILSVKGRKFLKMQGDLVLDALDHEKDFVKYCLDLLQGGANSFGVFIGEEHLNTVFYHTGILLRRGELGMLGIMGPIAMDYPALFSFLKEAVMILDQYAQVMKKQKIFLSQKETSYVS
eukprot:COSAG01_NODE_3_length_63519_cov_1591.007663_6_plen_352_part_00